MNEHDIDWLARLCDVAFSRTLLQLLRETHATAHALQAALRRRGQNLTTLWIMEGHERLTPNAKLTDDEERAEHARIATLG